MGFPSASLFPGSSLFPQAGLTLATGSYWTAAQNVFASDTYFCGSDGGASVDLGGTRTLWFFNDPFIRTSPGQPRTNATIIRNCVAIQSVSYDLSTCTMTFYCAGYGTSFPGSFFPERATASGSPSWSWGGAGVMLDGILIIFLSRVSPTQSSGSGFQFIGYDVVLVDNPTSAPSAWSLNYLQTPGSGLIGSFNNVTDPGDGFVYASTGVNDAARSVGVVRWDRAQLKSGNAMSPQHWRGPFGWSQRDNGKPPRVPVYQAGSSSSPTGSVAARSSDFALVASPGFGAVGIQIQYALSSARTGPFPAPIGFFTPYGNDPNLSLAGSNYFVYGAGAHPEQTWSGKGANDMLLTYSTNAAGTHNVRTDETIYYVRPVKGVGLV